MPRPGGPQPPIPTSLPPPHAQPSRPPMLDRHSLPQDLNRRQQPHPVLLRKDTVPSCRINRCHLTTPATHSNVRHAHSDRSKSLINQPTCAVASVHHNCAMISFRADSTVARAAHGFKSIPVNCTAMPGLLHDPLQHKHHRRRRHVAEARQHLARRRQRTDRQLESLLPPRPESTVRRDAPPTSRRHRARPSARPHVARGPTPPAPARIGRNPSTDRGMNSDARCRRGSPCGGRPCSDTAVAKRFRSAVLMRNRPRPDYRNQMSRMCLGKAGPRRDDDPATVDDVREQAPYSQYNGYSLRRDPRSFDSTLQEGNRMTICSWRTQSPERHLNFRPSTCAPEIDRSSHPCGRSRYSGYPVLCLAFPDSSIAEWTQMTESSSSCSLLEHANRESKCLTTIHATSAGRR
jgi:hypothetical protein